MDAADGAAALGGGDAALHAVLSVSACGATPAAAPYGGDKENATAGAVRANVPAPAGVAALKGDASAAALGLSAAPALAAENSFDGCASRADASRVHASRCTRRAGARHCARKYARAARGEPTAPATALIWTRRPLTLSAPRDSARPQAKTLSDLRDRLAEATRRAAQQAQPNGASALPTVAPRLQALAGTPLPLVSRTARRAAYFAPRASCRGAASRARVRGASSVMATSRLAWLC